MKSRYVEVKREIQLMVYNFNRSQQQLMELKPILSLKAFILEKGGGAMVNQALQRGISYHKLVPVIQAILLEKNNGEPVDVKRETLRRYMVDWRKNPQSNTVQSPVQSFSAPPPASEFTRTEPNSGLSKADYLQQRWGNE